ncbi:LAETG motif-containing sortase-dependent surface protein [Streptomyces sp. NPDC002265]|uniref:LAETG motif-containing sortase-dependent surface protein n=1 Tax=Streptomyces sp. NPDC002265 TaxID=3154415 RepID=UPI0033307EA4
MSISRRTARRSVRILGVSAASAALALGVAGNALACNISEFQDIKATCDGAKGAISVTDFDASNTTVTISVFLENNNADVRTVGAQTVKGSKEGVVVSFPEDWQPNATYRILVQAGTKKIGEKTLTTPAEACKAEDTTTPSTPSTPSSPAESTTTPADDESDSASPAPSATESETAAAAQGNAPSAAEVGESNLAETGANSNTGMIAGIAGALVVVGGGAVFFGMRRRGASSKS